MVTVTACTSKCALAHLLLESRGQCTLGRIVPMQLVVGAYLNFHLKTCFILSSCFANSLCDIIQVMLKISLPLKQAIQVKGQDKEIFCSNIRPYQKLTQSYILPLT